MIKTEMTTIGEHQYTATQLPAMEGMALLEWLMKKIGPGLEVMFGEDSDVAQTKLMQGVGTIFKNLSGKDLEYLYNQLCEHCMVNDVGMDKPQIKQFHFAGNYGEYMKWVIWMLQVNYQNFFDGLISLKNVDLEAGLPQTPKSKLEFRMESSGKSGE